MTLEELEEAFGYPKPNQKENDEHEKQKQAT